MSNSWVVHGSRTASGRPILANDPHLQIEMPGVWWEVHVVSDTLNVTGVTIPGIPFIIIGHNERLGWGLTNVGTDVQDFFIEQPGSITTEISRRRGMGASERAAARDSRQWSRRAGDLRGPIDAPWTGAESRPVARNVRR